MAHRCIVTRGFEFDPVANPEVLGEIVSLRDAGFSVYWEGDVPAPTPQPAEPEAGVPPRDVVAGIVAELIEEHKLPVNGLAALAGVHRNAVRGWLRQSQTISPRCWELLSGIYRRAASGAEAAASLRSEAKGASLARHRAKGKSWGRRRVVRLSDEQKIEMVERRRAGETFQSIGERFGVDAGRAHRVVSDLT